MPKANENLIPAHKLLHQKWVSKLTKWGPITNRKTKRYPSEIDVLEMVEIYAQSVKYSCTCYNVVRSSFEVEDIILPNKNSLSDMSLILLLFVLFVCNVALDYLVHETFACS